MKLTDKQLHILQHSLGCDKYGRPDYKVDPENGYLGYRRSHFVTDPDCPDGIFCEELAANGLMKDHGPTPYSGGMHFYTVTKEGVEAMKDQSPKPPKLSASKRRYQDFLSADSGMRFGEWLKLKREGSRNL